MSRLVLIFCLIMYRFFLGLTKYMGIVRNDFVLMKLVGLIRQSLQQEVSSRLDMAIATRALLSCFET